MIHKKLLTPGLVAALLTIALIFVFIKLWISQLHNVINDLLALAIYGLIIAGYLFGFVTILFGVFSIYKTIKEYVNCQDYQITEV